MWIELFSGKGELGVLHLRQRITLFLQLLCELYLLEELTPVLICQAKSTDPWSKVMAYSKMLFRVGLPVCTKNPYQM